MAQAKGKLRRVRAIATVSFLLSVVLPVAPQALAQEISIEPAGDVAGSTEEVVNTTSDAVGDAVGSTQDTVTGTSDTVGATQDTVTGTTDAVGGAVASTQDAIDEMSDAVGDAVASTQGEMNGTGGAVGSADDAVETTREAVTGTGDAVGGGAGSAEDSRGATSDATVGAIGAPGSASDFGTASQRERLRIVQGGSSLVLVAPPEPLDHRDARERTALPDQSCLTERVLCLSLLFGLGRFAADGADVLGTFAMTGVQLRSLIVLMIALFIAGSGALAGSRRRSAMPDGEAT